MLSGKLKARTNDSLQIGKGIRLLTEREANETIGGYSVRADLGTTGSTSDDFPQRADNGAME